MASPTPSLPHPPTARVPVVNPRLCTPSLFLVLHSYLPEDPLRSNVHCMAFTSTALPQPPCATPCDFPAHIGPCVVRFKHTFTRTAWAQLMGGRFTISTQYYVCYVHLMFPPDTPRSQTLQPMQQTRHHNCTTRKSFLHYPRSHSQRPVHMPDHYGRWGSYETYPL